MLRRVPEAVRQLSAVFVQWLLRMLARIGLRRELRLETIPGGEPSEMVSQCVLSLSEPALSGMLLLQVLARHGEPSTACYTRSGDPTQRHCRQSDTRDEYQRSELMVGTPRQ